MIAYRNQCIQAGVLLKLAVKHKLIDIHRDLIDLILDYVFWQKPLYLYAWLEPKGKYHTNKNCGGGQTPIRFPSLGSAHFIEGVLQDENNCDLIGLPIFKEYLSLIVIGRVCSVVSNKIRGVCWVPWISAKCFRILFQGRMEPCGIFTVYKSS